MLRYAILNIWFTKLTIHPRLKTTRIKNPAALSKIQTSTHFNYLLQYDRSRISSGVGKRREQNVRFAGVNREHAGQRPWLSIMVIIRRIGGCGDILFCFAASFPTIHSSLRHCISRWVATVFPISQFLVTADSELFFESALIDLRVSSWTLHVSGSSADCEIRWRD